MVVKKKRPKGRYKTVIQALVEITPPSITRLHIAVRVAVAIPKYERVGNLSPKRLRKTVFLKVIECSASLNPTLVRVRRHQSVRRAAQNHPDPLAIKNLLLELPSRNLFFHIHPPQKKSAPKNSPRQRLNLGLSGAYIDLIWLSTPDQQYHLTELAQGTR